MTNALLLLIVPTMVTPALALDIAALRKIT
jgi:hypothetical protein